MDTSHLLKEERALDQHFDKCAVRCVVRKEKNPFPRRANQKHASLGKT